MIRPLTPALVALWILAACGEAPEEPPLAGDDLLLEKPPAAEAMVAAANPLAVEAGLEALRAGGDAVDAAIAVQAVLGLVEPQSSGVGGGAFMVRYDAGARTLHVYDGRETAPAGIDETLFLDEAGEPLGFIEAWTSGRSVGVPGVIAMLAMAHQDHGARPWAAGFEDAITLAEEGFAVSPRLHDLITRVADFTPLAERADTGAYFFTEAGEPLPEGAILTNRDYAQSLRAIAADPRALYEGPLAEAIVAAAGAGPLAGALTLEDLAAYEPIRREALCAPYRGYQVCSAPPPAGGVAVLMLLGILDHFDLTERGPDTVDGWRLFIEASRFAYADRDAFIADPAFADVPTAGLLDPGYLRSRAALIPPERALRDVRPGRPDGAPNPASDASQDAPGTSHFVIVDADGDVVSMTTTVESPFGSHRMAGGFLLNNQLTDFAFSPRDEAGRLRANAPAAGKRPRSSMSPVIVLDAEAAFVLATGSPGGNSIIAYTAKSLVALIDWGLSPSEAAAVSNVVARGERVRLEDGFDPEIAQALEALGFSIEAGRGENSGLHIVRAGEAGLEGAADPRREGVARAP